MKHHRMVFGVVVLALVLVSARDAAADQLVVLCSNGFKAVLEDLIPKFEKATQHTVNAKYGLAAVLEKQIDGGEAFDVAILTPAAIDNLVAHGKVAANTRTTLARTGLAFAVKAGTPKRDVSTTDAFKKTLLNAKSVAYAGQGASGVAFAAIVQRLGIADALKPKSRVTATGEEVNSAVVNGEVELGVLPLSEILPIKGAEVLAQFPSEVQSYIVMVGGVNAASLHASAGRDLIAFVTAPAAAPVIKAKGMEKQ